MSFRFLGLDPAPFLTLYDRPEADLAAMGVERHFVTQTPGFPDRIEVRDGVPGETMLLLNFEHQPAPTPYRASHAIFVREGATERLDMTDAVPDAVRIRPISLRAFDAGGAMTDADLVEGRDIEALIARFLADPDVAYLHAHYAKRGCYAARIERA